MKSQEIKIVFAKYHCNTCNSGDISLKVPDKNLCDHGGTKEKKGINKVIGMHQLGIMNVQNFVSIYRDTLAGW